MAGISLSRGTSRQVERIVGTLEGRFESAVVRALNRAGTTMRAHMARALSRDVGLPVNQVRDQLSLTRASAKHQVVRVGVSGRRIPLIKFGAKGPRPSKGRGRGVTYRLLGGAGRLPHAFIARVRGVSGVSGGGTGDHLGVFVRSASPARKSVGAWGKNLPIKQRYGPSLPHVFTKLSPDALAAGEASLIKNLQSEIRHALRGAVSVTG